MDNNVHPFQKASLELICSPKYEDEGQGSAETPTATPKKESKTV